MNLALEYFADNPIIDELVCWPPRAQRIRSLRACSVLFRKPFIEIEMQDGELIHRHFERQGFAAHWAEASVILETITGIELKAEFDYRPLADPEPLRRRVLEARAECIEEVEQMFAEGMYEQFLMQFGEDCKNLPAGISDKLAQARRALSGH